MQRLSGRNVMAKGQMRSNKEKKKPKQDKNKSGAGPSSFGQNPTAVAPATTSYKSQYGKKS